MRYFLIFVFFVSMDFSAQAQIDDKRSPKFEAYKQCFNAEIGSDRVSTESVLTDRGLIKYECGGDVARTWFNSLPTETEEIGYSQSAGRFVYRFFGPHEPGFCLHQIERADGSSADLYDCQTKG